MEPEHPQVSITEAFSQVPRELFLPEEERDYASSNMPLSIGHGQTNSQPSTVADMLRLLDPQPGDRVLDIGAGSGWTSALLGVLVGRQGHVTGVERHERLVERARTSLSLASADIGDSGTVEIMAATAGVLGLPDEAPFNRILVSAGAGDLPDQLVAQLEVGGVMVIPVRGEMLKVTRTGTEDDAVTVSAHGLYQFVPLVDD